MRKFAGYINLKNLNGVLYPSSIQNIMMKDYIQNTIKGTFYLSPTELLQAKFPITLNTLVGNETKVDGIVMLSSFYLPESYMVRKKIYKIANRLNKSLHFILDELIFRIFEDEDKIEEYLIFNNPFFTRTKSELSKEEKYFMKKFKKVSFV